MHKTCTRWVKDINCAWGHEGPKTLKSHLPKHESSPLLPSSMRTVSRIQTICTHKKKFPCMQCIEYGDEFSQVLSALPVIIAVWISGCPTHTGLLCSSSVSWIMSPLCNTGMSAWLNHACSFLENQMENSQIKGSCLQMNQKELDSL